MSEFLEECKVRFAEVQKRVQAAHQELQAVQVRYQTAVQEQNALQFLINSVTAEEQRNSGTPTARPVSGQQSVADSITQTDAVNVHLGEMNKTDMIRDLLRRHPAGMTPTEIWKEVKGQMTHRAYLYSVLGRLKDKDEVIVKRKKYIFRIDLKTIGEKEQATVN
jgi:hypothetical protein